MRINVVASFGYPSWEFSLLSNIVRSSVDKALQPGQLIAKLCLVVLSSTQLLCPSTGNGPTGSLTRPPTGWTALVNLQEHCLWGLWPAHSKQITFRDQLMLQVPCWTMGTVACMG